MGGRQAGAQDDERAWTVDWGQVRSAPASSTTAGQLSSRNGLSVGQLESQGSLISISSDEMRNSADGTLLHCPHIILPLYKLMAWYKYFPFYITEMKKFLCTWLGEVCYSCSLTVLSGPAWVVLNYVWQRIFFTPVYAVLRILVITTHPKTDLVFNWFLSLQILSDSPPFS